MQRQKNDFGFSLIELILVISLILVIGSFASVFSSRLITQSSLSNTSDEIAGQLRKAQLYSMMGRQNSNWGVAYQGHTLTLYQGNSYAGRNAAFDETFSINPSVTVSGLTDVVFTRFSGAPSSSLSITLTGAGETKTLTVNSQGIVNR